MSAIQKGLVLAFVLVTVSYFIIQTLLEKSQSIEKSNVVNNQFEKMQTEGVPYFDSKTLNGSDFSLKNIKNKIVIINFWASWCGPCVEEFPSMIKLIQEYKGDIGLVAISLDSNKKDMESFLKIFSIHNDKNWTLIWDPEFKLAELYGTSKLPESYVITGDRKLVKKVAGSIDWQRPDIQELFQSLLN